MSKIFCERVREIIQIRGRTNQEVADAIGVDRKIVIKLKNDPLYVPRVDVVTKLADDMGGAPGMAAGPGHGNQGGRGDQNGDRPGGHRGAGGGGPGDPPEVL